jgi:Ca-activated chloride channel homolog
MAGKYMLRNWIGSQTQTSKKCALWGIAAVALLAIGDGGNLLRSQSSGDAQRDVASDVNDSWPEVNFNVVVLDKQGAPQAVDVSKFQLFEDGVQRSLSFRGSPDSPVSICFIIDNSGSMYNRRGSAKTVIDAIMKGLPNDSEVMAVTFNSTARLDLRFTPAARADVSFLDRLNPYGGTALYDAINVAEEYFGSDARYLKRAIVLLSDGEDNSSHSKKEDAIRSMQQPDAPTFYSFLLSESDATFSEARQNKRTLEDLARAGGGVGLTPKEKELTSAAAHLTDVIRSQYILRFAAVDPTRDGNAHKLAVLLPIKDAQVHTLPIYFAPAK